MGTHFEPDTIEGTVTCPYCGSTDTELFSLFGQQLLTVQFYCQTCHTPFEHVKDDALLNKRGVAHIATQRSSEQAQ
jgi:Zn finger protein HypA/HybF involved in hydrogenase expression